MFYKNDLCDIKIHAKYLSILIILAPGINYAIFGIIVSAPTSKYPCSLHQVNESDLKKYDGNLCARNCTASRESRICYYQFHIEEYTSMGPACNRCSAVFPQDCSIPQCVPGGGIKRRVYTINRMIPGPTIEICEDDLVVVDVNNYMDSVSTTIHWHGVHQKGTPWMDGVPFISQCPIVSNFRYTFCASPSGTHMYHSHSSTQQSDGLYGPLIIKDPVDPYLHDYDYDLPEHVMMINHWYHSMSDLPCPPISNVDLSQSEKFPYLLINGKGSTTDPFSLNNTGIPHEEFFMEPRKRYRFRIISLVTKYCQIWMSVQQHSMTLISQDGNPVEAHDIGTLSIFAGERYDVIITANQKPAIYHVLVRTDCNLEAQTADLIYKQLGVHSKPLKRIPLDFNSGFQYPVANNGANGCIGDMNTKCLKPIQGLTTIPENLKLSKSHLTLLFSIRKVLFSREETFKFKEYSPMSYGRTKCLIGNTLNNKSAINPHYTLHLEPERLHQDNDFICPEKCDKLCYCVNLHKLPLNSIVDVIIYSEEKNFHPFHLHGTNFFVLHKGNKDECKKYLADPTVWMANNNQSALRDVITWPQDGCSILRFQAFNPGFWIFHCHFIPHSETGMDTILQVGDTNNFPTLPPNIPRC